MSRRRPHDHKLPKGPAPVCPICKTADDVVPERNFGIPTGGWHCNAHRGRVIVCESCGKGATATKRVGGGAAATFEVCEACYEADAKTA